MDYAQTTLPPLHDLTRDLVKRFDQYLEGGAFGDVYMCDYNDGLGVKKVAVKALRFTFDDGDKIDKPSRMLRRELEIWRRLNHKNIVPFLGIAHGYGMHGAMSLVSLWMPNGTLGNHLEKHGNDLNIVHRLRLLLDIARGLEHLHSFTISGTPYPIIHGDLNPNNVLVDADYTARLADFGFASVVGEIPEMLACLQRSTTRPGAIRWIAPEQISWDSDHKLTIKSDIYSFGNIAFQVFSGKHPWSEVREENAIVIFLHQGLKPARPGNDPIEDSFWDFINLCWAPINKRPEAGGLVVSIQRFLDDRPHSQTLSDMFMSVSELPSSIGVSAASGFPATDSADPSGPNVNQSIANQGLTDDDTTPSISTEAHTPGDVRGEEHSMIYPSGKNEEIRSTKRTSTSGGRKAPNQIRQQIVMPLNKQRFESTYVEFCRTQKINPVFRVSLSENQSVELYPLHVHVIREGGGQSVSRRDMWSIIGGRLGFIQFPTTDTEPPRCGPGIAQHLQHAYKEYLHHFEHAYVLTVGTRTTPQQLMQPMNPLTPGNAVTPGMAGNPSEVTPNPPPMTSAQLVAAARYAQTSVPDMRAQHVSEQLINFVDRHRAKLLKLYQQQKAQLHAKRKEQEQQNVANGQGQTPNVHGHVPMGMQPDIQRPFQPTGPRAVGMVPAAEPKLLGASLPLGGDVGVALSKPPTHDQIQHPDMTIPTLKRHFLKRLDGMPSRQIPDEQRLEYNRLLEQVFKMSSDLDDKLPMYFAVFKSEEVIRKYIPIVMTVARQWQLVSTSSLAQYIIDMATLRDMQMQILKLNAAIKAASIAFSTPSRYNIVGEPLSRATYSHKPSRTMTFSTRPPQPILNPTNPS